MLVASFPVPPEKVCLALMQKATVHHDLVHDSERRRRLHVLVHEMMWISLPVQRLLSKSPIPFLLNGTRTKTTIQVFFNQKKDYYQNSPQILTKHGRFSSFWKGNYQTLCFLFRRQKCWTFFYDMTPAFSAIWKRIISIQKAKCCCSFFIIVVIPFGVCRSLSILQCPTGTAAAAATS